MSSKPIEQKCEDIYLDFSDQFNCLDCPYEDGLNPLGNCDQDTRKNCPLRNNNSYKMNPGNKIIPTVCENCPQVDVCDEYKPFSEDCVFEEARFYINDDID